MPAPANVDEFLDLIRKSGVVEEGRLSTYVQQLQSTSNIPTDLSKLAGLFVRDGLLTFFQAEQFLLGKWKRFTIGKYKVLERLGSGGMGQVFLCEHKLMRRKVAVKVLPTAKAEDPSSLERFYREARAVAALDHPNIVRAYDIDQDDNLHFLVMEYVDGISFQDLIKKHGPLDVNRACHYMYWSAVGLGHAHEAGLIHRDIKPGNILIDRQGTVKILDMGLARFFNDDEDLLTKKYDESILGTADYLAPEQAIDSHGVDGRADIYSLGATFYFLLSGHQPFVEGTVAQKLIWHQTRNPKPIRDERPDVPTGVAAIVEKMMAKEAANRYQTPAELAEALSPWVQTPIEAPPEHEMPKLSAAALSVGGGPASIGSARPAPQVPPPSKSGGSGTKPGSGSDRPTKPKNTTVQRGSQTLRATNQATVSDSEETKRRNSPAPIIESLPNDTDPAVWESLAADTNDVARDKTDRRPPPKSKTVKRVEQAPPKAPSPPSKNVPRKSRLPLIVASLVVVAAVASFCVWWFVLRTPEKNGGSQNPNGDSLLTVSLAGGTGKFNSVRDALAQAKEGDRIIIEDSPWVEDLQYNGTSNHGKGISIEGADGKEVIWKVPAGTLSEGILKLSNPRGLKLRNLQFDGGNVIGSAIIVNGNVAGMVIEDVKIVNTTEAGIKFKDCSGSDANIGQGALVQRVRVICNSAKLASTAEAGIVFLGTDETRSGKRELRGNDNIAVRMCRFEGGFRKAAFLFQGSTARIELKNNRVFQAVNGIYFNEFKAGYAYQVKISGNTFFGIKDAAIHFKNAAPAVQMADASLQKLEIEQNYFATNEAKNNYIIIRADDNAAFPIKREHITDNARNRLVKEGNPSMNAETVEATLSLDPNDEGFLRSSGPLVSRPKPIGVPPAH